MIYRYVQERSPYLFIPSWPYSVSIHDKRKEFKEGYRQALYDVLELNGIDLDECKIIWEDSSVGRALGCLD